MTIHQISPEIDMAASGAAISAFCQLGANQEASLEDALKMLDRIDLSNVTEDTKRFGVTLILTKLKDLFEEEVPAVDISKSIAQMPFDDDIVYEPFTARLREVHLLLPALLTQERLESVAYAVAVHNGQSHHPVTR